MKKLFVLYVLSIALVFGFATSVSASTYVVQKCDTLWLISKKHNISLTKILQSNPQIKNPNLIYPNQNINVPNRSYDSPSSQSEAEQVLNLVNEERSKAGLKSLRLSSQLNEVALAKSKDMMARNYFSHQSPTYGSPFDMLQKFGVSYKTAGENIAVGQKTPQEVMDAWMKSKGHRENILNPRYTEIGIGYAQGGSYRTYWTQLFIGK